MSIIEKNIDSLAAILFFLVYFFTTAYYARFRSFRIAALNLVRTMIAYLFVIGSFHQWFRGFIVPELIIFVLVIWLLTWQMQKIRNRQKSSQ